MNQGENVNRLTLAILILVLLSGCPEESGPTPDRGDASNDASGSTDATGDAMPSSDAAADAVSTVECCCSHIPDGGDDILEEIATTTEECAEFEQGQCIDPTGRFTPHPCCPDATGDRCP